MGLIPEDWEIKTIGDYYDVGSSKRVFQHQWRTDGIPFYRARDIVALNNNTFCCELYIDVELYEFFKTKYGVPKVGDILVTGVGTLGAVYVIDNPTPFYYKDGNIICFSTKGTYDSSFLYYLFHSPIIKNQIIDNSGGSTVGSYTINNAKGTKIIVPPIFEQSRIAEALSDIDKLITSLSKMIEKKRLMKQGAMQQLLTGKKRLPGFEGEWEERTIGEICELRNGYTPSKGIADYWQNGTIPWFRMEDIRTNGHILRDSISHITPEAIKGSLFPANSIIISTTATIGEHALLIVDSLANQRFTNLLIRKSLYSQIDIMYFYWYCYILGEWCRKNINEGGLTAVNMIDFVNVLVPFPPTIQEQSAIANILTTMDNEIDALEEERDKYRQVKEGMMQKLLTGQIRLVETEARVAAMPKAKGANVHFKRSVLAAEIADRLCEEPTFGHVKMEKLIFLTEHLCHIDIGSHYHRDAAGPYDNTALRSIDSQMKRNKWFEAKKTEQYYRYVPLQKRGDHKKYFDKYYADVLPMFDKVIETFKTSTTEQCEIVATLYSAWDDLLHRGQPFTDDDILNEVLNHWHESKKRIPRNRWQTALTWMRNNGFAPENA